MAQPTYAQLRNPASTSASLFSEAVQERLLTILAMIASGQNPDGTAFNLVPTALSAISSATTSAAARVGGNITCTSANSTLELAAQTGGPGTGGFDLTLAAAAGDQILVAFDASCFNNAAIVTNVAYAALDAMTVVGGVNQHTVANAGLLGLSIQVGIANNSTVPTTQTGLALPLVASALYTVVSGDISGGNVTFRPFVGVSVTSLLIARSSNNGPFIFSVANLKH